MAAGSTYTPIATTTISGGTTASYTFSSISGSYTDLILIVAGKGNSGDFCLRFNSDTGTNYSNTVFYGNGTSAFSARDTSINRAIVGKLNSSDESTSIINIMNYSNTTTYKTALSRSGPVSVQTGAYVNLWRSTSAITSVEVYVPAGYFTAGLVLSLYGITAA